MLLNQAVKFLKPKYALSSHSFTAQYEDTPKKEYEVGLLFRERSPLVDKIEEAFKKNNVDYRLNLPYDPKEGVCFAMDSVSTSLWPEFVVKTAMLEFRNDLITDVKYRANMVNILAPVFMELNDKI